MKTVRIYENDELKQELDHTPEIERTARLDCELWNSDGRPERRVEIYEPPPVLTLEETKEQTIARFSRESFSVRMSIYPDYKLTNAALGVYGETERESAAQLVQAYRDEFYRLKGLVDAAETVDAVAEIEPVWPEA
jgi:hypothetical protein